SRTRRPRWSWRAKSVAVASGSTACPAPLTWVEPVEVDGGLAIVPPPQTARTAIVAAARTAPRDVRPLTARTAGPRRWVRVTGGTGGGRRRTPAGAPESARRKRGGRRARRPGCRARAA